MLHNMETWRDFGKHIFRLFSQQKQQYELPLLRKSGLLNQGLFGSQPYGLGMPHSGKKISNSSLPSLGFGNPLFENERISHINSTMRSSMGGSGSSWHADIDNNMETCSMSSRTTKPNLLNFSDITDHQFIYDFEPPMLFLVAWLWKSKSIIYAIMQ
ncbi:putative nucleic acid binding NABP [Medicago truncatula]|uniref:Nucleic acid-binding protein NABP protein n=1 Tax=Medicago truncatula TaxID=3880 RepID=G7L928_MEDTR|nr:nucleic acid-binding protein NABP protein [Medicago truncatula]RHN39536.1 putative nucleic acid binding NABP [Medicago truncatula]